MIGFVLGFAFGSAAIVFFAVAGISKNKDDRR